MKVIRKGSNKQKVITCPRCDSDIQYNNSDTYLSELKLILPKGDYKAPMTMTIKCPICNNEIQGC